MDSLEFISGWFEKPILDLLEGWVVQTKKLDGGGGAGSLDIICSNTITNCKGANVEC